MVSVARGRARSRRAVCCFLFASASHTTHRSDYRRDKGVQLFACCRTRRSSTLRTSRRAVELTSDSILAGPWIRKATCSHCQDTYRLKYLRPRVRGSCLLLAFVATLRCVATITAALRPRHQLAAGNSGSDGSPSASHDASEGRYMSGSEDEEIWAGVRAHNCAAAARRGASFGGTGGSQPRAAPSQDVRAQDPAMGCAA